ncbi:MAG: DUF4058 family protein, partial [Planctomycetaceae bacterium]
RAGSNIVEIDLLRSGHFSLSVPQSRLPPPYRAPYRICVVEALNPQDALVYRVSLREPLPTIRIPLRYSDDEVFLDLQTLLEQTYRDGGYDDLDYTADPVPPLEADDSQWADELLKAKDKRSGEES